MDNLLNERGVIGTFHGRDVELVDREIYDSWEAMDYERIYGLIEEGNGIILLVFQGRWIGTMTKEGNVTEFKNTKKYSKSKGRKKPSAEELRNVYKEKKKEEIVVPTVDDLLRMAIEDKLYEEVMFNGRVC